MSSRLFPAVLTITILFSIGCRSMNQYMPWGKKDISQAPETPVLSTNATLPEILSVVNQQNRQIQSLSAHSASISIPRTPALSADIVYHQPSYFHLSAKTNVTGKEVDMGTNPELFWYWIARNESPGVYYCRHDQYAQSGVSQQLPIEPMWVVDALGVKPLDETLNWQGPRLTEDDTFFEIRAQEQTPKGEVTRVVYIDRRTGTIAAQRLYDSEKMLLVDTTVRQTRRDALTGFYAPQKIDVVAPRFEFKLSIDLGAFDLNRVPDEALTHWGIPQNLGAPLVNMARP